MGGSRTIKTLGLLLLAMTAGTVVLAFLQTEPVRPGAQPLAVLAPPPAGAAGVIYETRVPIQRIKWRYLVVHAARSDAEPTARGCHFLIRTGPDGQWEIHPTGHWLVQGSGRHIGSLWADSSVGICLIGDFSRRGPAERQFDLLVELVHALQDLCGIPADRVYLHSDLVARSTSPGAAFPAERFTRHLLQAAR